MKINLASLKTLIGCIVTLSCLAHSPNSIAAPVPRDINKTGEAEQFCKIKEELQYFLDDQKDAYEILVALEKNLAIFDLVALESDGQGANGNWKVSFRVRPGGTVIVLSSSAAKTGKFYGRATVAMLCESLQTDIQALIDEANNLGTYTLAGKLEKRLSDKKDPLYEIISFVYRFDGTRSFSFPIAPKILNVQDPDPNSVTFRPIPRKVATQPENKLVPPIGM